MLSPMNLQKSHFEEIHDEYARHYYDPVSMQYRWRFIYEYWFQGIDLNGKKVADLACGDGVNSLAVLSRFPDADVTGVDISPKACEAYTSVTGRKAYAVDLTLGIDIGIYVDAAVVFGGLHHCVLDLRKTFQTISYMIKPGGLLLMAEPNRDCFWEPVRRIWYRMDNYFDDVSEAALAHDEMFRIVAADYEQIWIRYQGGPAYFLLLNSLILRVPLPVKRFMRHPLFWLETAYNCLPGRFWYPTFLACWRRK